MENASSIKRLRVVGAGAAIAFLNEVIRRLDPKDIDNYNKKTPGQKFITCINPWERKIYRIGLNAFDFKTFYWGNIFDDLTMCQLRAFGLLSQDDYQVIMVHGKGKPQVYADRARPQSEMPVFPDYVYDPFLAWPIIANVFGHQDGCGGLQLAPKQDESPFYSANCAMSFSSGTDAIWVLTIATVSKEYDSDNTLNIVHRERAHHHTNGFYHSL